MYTLNPTPIVGLALHHTLDLAVHPMANPFLFSMVKPSAMMLLANFGSYSYAIDQIMPGKALLKFQWN